MSRLSRRPGFLISRSLMGQARACAPGRTPAMTLSAGAVAGEVVFAPVSLGLWSIPHQGKSEQLSHVVVLIMRATQR